MRQLPNDIARLLRASGRPWELRNGKRHFKLFIDGRMVTILPHARLARCDSPGAKTRAHLNLLARIRKAVNK